MDNQCNHKCFEITPLTAAPLAKGDYVLATKWTDGDPQDHWCVGFFSGLLHKTSGVRYEVVDGQGCLFRGNGFRRIMKISKLRGAWLLARVKEIESSFESVWDWVQKPMAKRYLLFTGYHFYPEGGMKDFYSDFDTPEEALSEVQSMPLNEWAWAHIWDSQEQEIVWEIE